MPRGKRKGPQLALIPLDTSAKVPAGIDHLDEASTERIIALVPWVGGLRTTFGRQWPARGVEQGTGRVSSPGRIRSRSAGRSTPNW